MQHWLTHVHHGKVRSEVGSGRNFVKVSASHLGHEAGQHVRRCIIWRYSHAADERLRGIVACASAAGRSVSRR